MSELNLQQFIQGGGIGIAILLIIYSAWKDKLYNKTMNNHIAHFTDALNRNTNVITKNTDMTQQTMRVMDRIERCLDKK
jgi:hypothetical protein